MASGSVALNHQFKYITTLSGSGQTINCANYSFLVISIRDPNTNIGTSVLPVSEFYRLQHMYIPCNDTSRLYINKTPNSYKNVTRSGSWIVEVFGF